jgi:phage baseplate assembly protein W
MAIIDTSKTKKPFLNDRDEDVFIGIDLPFHRGNDKNGFFAMTSTTLEAVKVNAINLLQTELGERLMQPNLGMRLRRYLFEPFTEDVRDAIQNSIVDTFSYWLPFVEIVTLNVDMSEANTLRIFVEFVLNRDPTTTESVQVTIGG